MRCIDTPLLEALLRGRASSVRWQKLIRDGGELATTEVNLLELAQRGLPGPPSSAARRLGALERVRKCLTVLPLDAEGSRRAVGLMLESKRGGLHSKGGGVELEPLLVAAICLSRGVPELYTDRKRIFPRSLKGLHLVRV